ncbi:MAG: hypothetical protein JWQ32_750 [Marmoricola sp.]|nr:hypothetical protein [Marmoricola sp.]
MTISTAGGEEPEGPGPDAEPLESQPLTSPH